jgi:hypothetical protein
MTHASRRTWLLVSLLALVAAVGVIVATGCTTLVAFGAVEGHVLAAGVPVEGATVIGWTIEPGGSVWVETPYVGTTDANGYYSFRDTYTGSIPPAAGPYRIVVVPPSGSGLAFQFYDGARDVWGGKNVNVAIDTTSVADLNLTPGGGIAGTVSEPGGALLAGARVYPFLKDGSGQWSFDNDLPDSYTTGADGKYGIDRLAPGAYRLEFMAPDHVTAYNGGAKNVLVAADVLVTAGATATVDSEIGRAHV